MENRPHNEEFREKWFRMPVAEQMANIGKEVAEAICWKETVSYTHLTLPTICSV